MARGRLLAVLAATVLMIAAGAARGGEKPSAAAALRPPAAPPVVLETAMSVVGDHVPQCAFDGKTETYFQSGRPVKTGDAFTLTLAEPARVTRIEVLAGRPGVPEIVEGLVLETSADGQAFTQAARFEAGGAKADLGGGPVKAVRVRATADSPARLSLREITLAAQPPVPVFRYPIAVVLDAGEVPDMQAWCERTRGLLEQWYPVMAEALADADYTPPRRIQLMFRKGAKGIAATSGANITAYDAWFKAHPDDAGAILHEGVHVIQSYPRGNPSWLVEGIADYVRFWIFEPQTPRRRLDPSHIRHTDSYQVTAAFLAWAVQTHDPDLVRKLNAACRRGQYKDGLFKEYTGKDVDALFGEFKESLKAK